jgi:transglutaminase-like putative cysteine protease
MEFNVSADLVYNAEEAGTLVLNIRPLKVVNESLTIAPGTINYLQYFSDMNRLLVLPVSAPGEISISYKATARNQFNYVDFAHLAPTSISQMVPAVLLYLNPSRYCQSDKLLRFAKHLFGHIENEFEKVISITEWIYTNVEYLSGSTTGDTSAYDTITQQTGVCRDFAHLGIALCQALDIPARYCSVYAYNLVPPDFHACFEAWLSGHWIMFDATKLAPLNGFVKISMGRDAADTSISNLFGKIIPQSMIINSVIAQGVMEPVFYYPGSTIGISYIS